MNHFLMLFMKNWLMNFSNLFFVDDWLMNFMNDVLMMFMNYVLVMLMNHILMMLVDDISVVLLDNWLQNMAINFGWLLRRLHNSLTLIDINDWFFIMPYYCSLLVIRLFNYRFLWVRNFDSWRIFWQLFKMALTELAAWALIAFYDISSPVKACMISAKLASSALFANFGFSLFHE